MIKKRFCDEDIEEAKEMLKDDYPGKWQSVADYVRNFLYETGIIARIDQYLFDVIKKQERMPSDKWHLDEMTVKVTGESFILWRRRQVCAIRHL